MFANHLLEIITFIKVVQELHTT